MEERIVKEPLPQIRLPVIGAVPSASNGNLTNDAVRIYVWDALNRLKKVYKNPSEYTYDALGRRIRKVVTNGALSGSIPNGTTDYAYNTGRHCVEKRAGSDDPVKQYAWGYPGRLLLRQRRRPENSYQTSTPTSTRSHESELLDAAPRDAVVAEVRVVDAIRVSVISFK